MPAETVLVTAAPEHHRVRAQAMGSEVVVHVVGADPGLLTDALHHIDRLEAAWSRFRPDSELMRLNARAGERVAVSAETYRLVALAVAGWHQTDGAFDPTVHDALVALGYDRSFELLATVHEPAGRRTVAVPAPGCDRIELDPVGRTVRLPRGVAIDPGGLGKGLAADLVVDALLTAGARGAMVSIGGDLRGAGDAPDGPSWAIDVADPFDADATLVTLFLAAGGVATSSRLRRAWTRGTEPTHHLLDPRTARPAATGLAAVTAVAANAATAEVAAKAAFVGGPVRGARAVEALGAAALLVTDDGRAIAAGPIEAFVP